MNFSKYFSQNINISDHLTMPGSCNIRLFETGLGVTVNGSNPFT